MLRGTGHCGTVWAICTVLLAGCGAVPSANPRAQKHNSSAEARRRPAGDGSLQKLAEAHAHYAAGVVEEVDEQPEAALKQYFQAALKDSENESLVLDVSRRFLQNKQPQQALELLSRAAARPNASGAIFAHLGFVYSQLGKFDQALAASRTAIKKAPGLLAGYQNLFVSFLQNKQPQEALKALDDAARQSKADGEFLIGLAELYVNLGMQTPSLRKETNAKALAVLTRAEKLNPINPAMRLKLAEDYGIAGDSAKAAQLYRELLKNTPDLPGLRERVRARLADIYLRGSDQKRAAEELEGIIAEDPTNAQAYYSLGVLALDGERFENAAEFLGKTILLSPDHYPAYYDLVRAQLALKKTSDAQATLQNARQKFPRNFALEYLSGVAFGQQKAFAEAIQHYTAAEVIAEATHPEWLDQHFYFDLGAAYERKGDYAQAEKSFEKCLQLAPEFPEALNYLGYMWAEHGWHLARAREMIEKALKLEPKNAAYLDSLAWVLYKSEQPKEALDYALKAVELEPNDASARNVLV